MIKKSLFSLLIFSSSFLWGQFESPVSLSAKVDDIARPGEVAEIVVSASMDEEWWIYALRDQGKGPVASNVIVVSDIVEESGMVLEDEPEEKYDA